MVTVGLLRIPKCSQGNLRRPNCRYWHYILCCIVKFFLILSLTNVLHSRVAFSWLVSLNTKHSLRLIDISCCLTACSSTPYYIGGSLHEESCEWVLSYSWQRNYRVQMWNQIASTWMGGLFGIDARSNPDSFTIIVVARPKNWREGVLLGWGTRDSLSHDKYPITRQWSCWRPIRSYLSFTRETIKYRKGSCGTRLALFRVLHLLNSMGNSVAVSLKTKRGKSDLMRILMQKRLLWIEPFDNYLLRQRGYQ